MTQSTALFTLGWLGLSILVIKSTMKSLIEILD